MIKGFFLQIKFLTRIPFFNIEFDEDKFARGIIFAPVVGLIIGGFLVLAYLGVSIFENRIITAITLVFFEVVLTGGLHLDGLADTCDGVFSGRSTEMMLEIMKDSRIGTNGTLAIILCLSFKTALLSSIEGSSMIACLLVMPVLSRYNIIVSSAISKYAREIKGMGEAIVKKTGLREMIIGILITLIICIPASRSAVIPLIITSLAFAFIFTGYVKSKLGGITGDIMGAVIEISEVAVLAAAFIIYSPVTGNIVSKFINI